MARTVKEIEKEIKSKFAEQDKLGDQQRALTADIDKLTAERDEVRTAGFDRVIVAESYVVGVNPHNFETEEQLQLAVEQFKKDHKIK